MRLKIIIMTTAICLASLAYAESLTKADVISKKMTNHEKSQSTLIPTKQNGPVLYSNEPVAYCL